MFQMYYEKGYLDLIMINVGVTNEYFDDLPWFETARTSLCSSPAIAD